MSPPGNGLGVPSGPTSQGHHWPPNTRQILQLLFPTLQPLHHLSCRSELFLKSNPESQSQTLHSLPPPPPHPLYSPSLSSPRLAWRCEELPLHREWRRSSMGSDGMLKTGWGEAECGGWGGLSRHGDNPPVSRYSV